MINQVYRLVSPRQFEVTYQDLSLQTDMIVIRPTHLSICNADQRYYTGSRGKEILEEKLPMALIHEGIGKVVYDPKGELTLGTRVVMVPNIPAETDEFIAENYRRTSRFRSSGYDGYMQDYIFIDRDRLVEVPEDLNPHVAAFMELITISMHSLTRFETRAHKRRKTFGVWGDGNLGFIMCLLLKRKYPESKVVSFGKTKYKMDRFSFVDEIYQIDEIPEYILIDHAFECVGGVGSQFALNQAIDHIVPEGTISLLGVSEYPVEVNTRMLLEKGITMFGSSRSGRADFENTVEFIKEYPDVTDYFATLIGRVQKVTSIHDIIEAFEKDLVSSWGKTIIEWNI